MDDHRPGAQDAERRAGAAEQQAFGEQRAAQRAGAGAERGTDGEFVFAPDRARENQIGDVRAGDDEDQHRRGQQHQQHGSGARRDLIAQAHGFDAEVGFRGIGFGMFLHHGAVDGAQFGAGLLESRRRARAGRTAPSCDGRGRSPWWPTGDAGW